MSSHNKIKTYGRANSSLVNNSIDAYNLLYSNKPKGVIRKRKKKNNYLIKELPSRPRCEPILLKEDSINVSTENTFDKLLKATRKFPKSTSPSNTVNISKSFNTLEPQCSQFIHSPIATRQKRKKTAFNTSNSLKICETEDSVEQTHLRRLNETSKDKIESSIEKECVQNQQPNYSLSYIKVPTPLEYSKIALNKPKKKFGSLDSSKLGVSINYFTKNLHENFAAKCSTPVNPNKRLKSNLLGIEHKTPNKTFDRSEFNVTNQNFSFKNMTDSDIQLIDSNRDIKSSNTNLSNKRRSFINLRKRKILKSNISHILTVSLKDFEKFEKQKHSFTNSLESFSKVEETNLYNNSSQKHIYSLKTFELFENLFSSPVNFVTKRKIISKDNSSLQTPCEESIFDSKIFKEVVVKLDKLNMPEITNNLSNKEFEKSLDSFEQFYNSNYSQIEDSEKCPYVSTANDDPSNFEAKDKTNINDSFENFYHSHYSFINSENEDDLSKNLTENILKTPSIQNIFNKELRINITKCSRKRHKDNIYNNDNPINVNSTNQTTFNDTKDFDKKNMYKNLKIKLKKNNVSNDKIECYKSNNLRSHSTSKQNNSKSDNEETQDNVSSNSYDSITNNTNSSYQTTFSDNSNLVEHVTADYNLDQFECNKSNNNDLQVDANNSNIEGKESLVTDDNFEKFYESNIDKYDFTSSILENNSQENIICPQEDSLDIIESSYIENLSLKENESNLLQIVDISHMPINKSDMPLKDKKKSSQSNTNSKMDTKNNSQQIVDVSQMSINKSDTFKIPKLNNIHLKSGKNWKRSFSIYKRNSVFYGFPNEGCCSPYLTKTCPKGKLSKLSNWSSCNNRLSVCLVPVKPIIELENETSILLEYAINPKMNDPIPGTYEIAFQLNTEIIKLTLPLDDSDEIFKLSSYVPDQIIDDSLQDSFRCLSLNQRNSLNNKNQLNRLPVTAKEIVLRRCGQTEPLEFSKCFQKSMLQHCHKIGEGVYGEVFLLRNPKLGTSVIKIVPVEGDLIVNGERQKKFEEVLSEIIITMELSNLKNNKRNGMKMFTEVQKIQCVQGKYPEQLLMLWDEYDENRGSENDCPDVFEDEQLYIIFQMGYGGKDLESFEFNSAMQAFSMFQQVAIGLAVAEEELQFEHRDLHWGNILISTVESNKFASFTLNNHNYEIPTMGVEVAIIDFTLSRIEHDGVVIFNDLSLDPDLFTADGDYQFEIYRLMQQRNGNLWKDFEPFTNILWLHYVLDKAILALRYKNTKTKRHKEYLRKLKILKEDILCFNNVKEFAIAKLL